MGKSPTGMSESTDNEPEEEEPEAHPDQTSIDEHGTSETGDSGEEESPTPPTGGDDGGGSAGGGGGPVATPGTTGDGVTPEGDETEDEPEEEPPEAGDPQEPPEPEEPKQPDETEDTEDPKNEDNEREQNEAEITIYTDSWDVTGWDNEPDLRRLKETFGDKLTIEYDYLPARTIEEWEGDTEMPTVDELTLPDSTADSYRALTAAQEQGLTRKYLRRLRIAALSEGRNIESKDVLVEIAEEVGLDTDRLQEDMTNVDVEAPELVKETPQMEVTIAEIPHFWTENIEFGRVFGRMVGEGVQPEPMGRMIPQFVADYEPVTTAEVAETFELDQDQALEELRQRENIVPRTFGAGTFWCSV